MNTRISFQALERAQGTSASIAESILEVIKNGSVRVGHRLPTEAELARDFGVSRPSVREALAALQFAGYVESRRGFGTVVVSTDPESFREDRPADALIAGLSVVDLYETRLVLEPYALATAAADPDLTALEEAGALIKGMRLAAAKPDLHAASDVSVHHKLLYTCRNEVLRDTAIRLVDLALAPVLVAARTRAWSSPDLPHVWVNHHEAVYNAIAARDPVAARATSMAHLESVLMNMAATAEGDSDFQRRIAAVLARTQGIPFPQYPGSPSPGVKVTSGAYHDSEE